MGTHTWVVVEWIVEEGSQPHSTGCMSTTTSRSSLRWDFFSLDH